MRPSARLATFTLVTMALTLPALAQDAPLDDTLQLGLEDLMNVVVTSASRKSQTLAETAAAAYVITADDIRRSGATNVPEALRLAPGVQVSSIGNNKWAVTIRGFADRFANKLLVLVDGRSVYTPLFSGVLWETLDVPLEFIERIEVIRGPGASIWGANAVNGVINIITRSPFRSQGGEVSVAGGSELRAAGTLHYGWTPDPDTAMSVRVFAKQVGPAELADGSAGADDWLNQGADVRVERLLDAGTLQFEGSASRSLAGDLTLMNTAPPASTYVEATQRVEQQVLQARWDSPTDRATHHSVLAYVAHSDYQHVVLDEHRVTADVEYQQHTDAGARHDLIWGVGIRLSNDRIEGSPMLSPDDGRVDSTLFSVYAQDEIDLQPGRWRLSVGARLDYNDFTHLGVQPNVRLSWTPTDEDSAWASLARALRTPSRLERGATIYLEPRPGVPALGIPPSIVEARGGPIGDERLDALDFGWRRQLSPSASLDVAAFVYRFENIRGSRLLAPEYVPPGYLAIPALANNANRSTEHGIEASFDWRVTPNWSLHASYGWLSSSVDDDAKPAQLPSEYADVSPSHLLSLRSSLDLPRGLHWDLWLRAASNVAYYDIPGYATLDTRLAWQPDARFEFAVVGQNLLDAAHPEFGSQFIQSMPTQIQRGAYATVAWRF